MGVLDAPAQVGKYAALPRNPSGRWYGPTVITTGNAGSSAGTLNRAEYAPILLAAGTLDRIAVNHLATPTASEVARLGLYSASTTDPSRPGARILDAGTVDLSTAAGVKAITISQVVTEGVYFLAVVRQGPTATATLANLPIPNQGLQSPIIAPDVDASTLYNSSRTVQVEAGVSGALPATATPARATISFVYAAAVRYA